MGIWETDIPVSISVCVCVVRWAFSNGRGGADCVQRAECYLERMFGLVRSPKSVRWMDVKLRERSRERRCHASSALDQNHNRQVKNCYFKRSISICCVRSWGYEGPADEFCSPLGLQLHLQNFWLREKKSVRRFSLIILQINFAVCLFW